MSKEINVFTDTVATDVTIDDSNIEKVVNQFLAASDDAVKAGETNQRAWLFTSKNPDRIREIGDWIKTGADIMNDEDDKTPSVGKPSKKSKIARNCCWIAITAAAAYGCYKAIDGTRLWWKKRKLEKAILKGEVQNEGEE